MEVLLNIFSILVVIGLLGLFWLAFSWLLSRWLSKPRNRIQTHRNSRLKELFPSGVPTPEEIVKTVRDDPEAFIPELHEFFWYMASATKVGANSYVDAMSMAYLPMDEYMEAFFEDALESIDSNKPIKSEKRRYCEQNFPIFEAERLTGKVGVSPSDKKAAQRLRMWLSQMDTTMEAIARQRLVADPFGTDSVVLFDRGSTKERLAHYKACVSRLRQLFQKPANFPLPTS